MALKQNHLERRNHTYYFRYWIPKNLRYFFKKEYIRYSLNTNDYNIAILLLKRETFKFDALLNDLDWLLMEIKNNKLILSDEDIENIVASRIKEIQDKLDDSYFKIKNNEVTFPELNITMLQERDYAHSGYRGDFEDFKDEQVVSFVKKYVTSLKQNKRIPPSVFDFLKRTVKKNAIEPNADQKPEWLEKLKTNLAMADDYAENRTDAIINDNASFYVPSIIERCLSYIAEERTANTVRSPKVKTHWTTLYEKFREYKRNVKGTGENTLDQDRSCLEVVFQLINKKYVENLTAKDCETISTKIYYVPRGWLKLNISGKKKLADCLYPEVCDKTIFTTTVKKYLRAFKEFLTYAQRKGYVSLALNIQIEIPVRDTRKSYERFTKEDLLKIFNPERYPYLQHEEYAYRYFLPIMGLYSGARLNELSQLYCEDIKKEGNIYYMELTDERPDQHLKNKASHRVVPIHPKIIEMGFIDYLQTVRAKRKKRVFYQLDYTKENHYTEQPSKWFARYLDEIGITSKLKVFHSFRHAVKPELRDAGVNREYQNAICGWEGIDTGEKVYGSNFLIPILYAEICKLQYPYLDDNLKKIKSRDLSERDKLRIRLYGKKAIK